MIVKHRPLRRHVISCVLIAPLIALFPLTSFACTVSASGASFGAFDPLEDVAVDTTGTVTVICSPSASYTIELGTGGAGTYTQREMLGPGNRILGYNLYQDPSRTTVWGDGSGGTATVAGSDDSSGSAHTIYGTIPAGQNPYVGSYSDLMVVTVIF